MKSAETGSKCQTQNTRLENFTAGLRSPDPEQRARFQKLSENFNLGRKLPREIGNHLWALEPAIENKRERGSPKIGLPWANAVWEMDEMRLLVGNGTAVIDASGQVAEKKGKSGSEERAKYIRRLYRQRQKLRE